MTRYVVDVEQRSPHLRAAAGKVRGVLRAYGVFWVAVLEWDSDTATLELPSPKAPDMERGRVFDFLLTDNGPTIGGVHFLRKVEP